MFWEIMEKIGIILGILSSVVGIVNFIIRGSKQGHFSLKEILVNGDPESFTWNLLASLTIYGILSVIIIPLGFIFPDFTFASGVTIFQLLGGLWLMFPIMTLFIWLD